MQVNSIIIVTAILSFAINIEARSNRVKRKFIEAKILPDVLDFLPDNMEFVKISYPSGVKVNLGNFLTPTQVRDQPIVQWKARKDAMFTFLMIALSPPEFSEVRHWLTVKFHATSSMQQSHSSSVLGLERTSESIATCSFSSSKKPAGSTLTPLLFPITLCITDFTLRRGISWPNII